VLHVGALPADQPSAISKWVAEKAAMASLGFKVVYDKSFDITTSNFTQQVVDMKNAGVKILFLEQMPQNYAASVVKALNQQDFHPVLVLGGSTYSSQLIPNSGGAQAINGSYLDQNTSLYLGADITSIPAVGTFQTWIQKTSPGFSPDLYTLFGWLSAELFAQALKSAGPNPSRGSVLQALHGITSFSGGNLIGTSNPAKKIPTPCYLIAQIEHGTFNRLDDPSVSGPSHGFRCDHGYYYVKPA
jgi:ABC-type branched-subunit amino acid transport system substrate-binding protein